MGEEVAASFSYRRGELSLSRLGCPWCARTSLRFRAGGVGRAVGRYLLTRPHRLGSDGSVRVPERALLPGTTTLGGVPPHGRGFGV